MLMSGFKSLTTLVKADIQPLFCIGKCFHKNASDSGENFNGSVCC